MPCSHSPCEPFRRKKDSRSFFKVFLSFCAHTGTHRKPSRLAKGQPPPHKLFEPSHRVRSPPMRILSSYGRSQFGFKKEVYEKPHPMDGTDTTGSDRRRPPDPGAGSSYTRPWSQRGHSRGPAKIGRTLDRAGPSQPDKPV